MNKQELKSKKYKVSIAISALNERENIDCVLRDIIEQKKDGWLLEEILVYCDGCTDDTEEVAALWCLPQFSHLEMAA